MNFERQAVSNAKETVQKLSSFRLIFWSLLVLIPIISPGSIGAFTSIAVPQMKLDLDEQSWFVSIVSLIDPIGSLFIGFAIDKYGRRFSMLASIVPNTVGWFLLADKNASLTLVYIGRILTGFAIGACALPAIIYAAECITINHHRIRSSLGTLVNMAMAIGGLLLYSLSVVLPYDRIALVLGLLSTLSFVSILIFLPESPIWLRQKGRLGDAEVAWRRLGMKEPILWNDAVRVTTATASAAVGTDPLPNGTISQLSQVKKYLGKIRRRDVYKPLVITVLYHFFCQFSGLYCVISFMIDLITVPSLETNPYLLSLVGQVLQIVGCLLTSVLLPVVGIRKLSVAGFSLVSLSSIALSLSLLYENSSAPSIFSYLHIVSVWTIMLAGVSVIGIAGAILGEMFPIGAKGFAALPLVAAAAFSFTVLQIFSYAWARHKSLTFFVFSAVSACSVAFVTIYLPETVGKTMDEIEERFRRSGTNLDSDVDESRVPMLVNRDSS